VGIAHPTYHLNQKKRQAKSLSNPAQFWRLDQLIIPIKLITKIIG